MKRKSVKRVQCVDWTSFWIGLVKTRSEANFVGKNELVTPDFRLRFRLGYSGVVQCSIVEFKTQDATVFSD